MKKTIHLLTCTVFCLSLFSAAFAEDNFDGCKGTSILEVDEQGIKVEVASDQRSRSYGLMFRRSLGANCGMIFVFEQNQFLTFTMRNTLIPLDIAFIDEKGTIKEILTMQPGVDRYPSRVQARYALEMNAGWFNNNKIEVGQTLQLRLSEELLPIDKLK